MHQPRRWWPGLVGLALLLVLALWEAAPRVEAALGAQLRQALAQAGHRWSEVSVAGRDVVLTGEAPAEAPREAAAAVVLAAAGVRSVDNRTRLLPLQDPYGVTLRRDGSTINIKGFMPDLDSRSAFLASLSAAVPGAEISSGELRLARGAPEGYAGWSALLPGFVRALAEGEVALSPAGLSVSGRSTDRAADETLRAAIAALPSGLTLVRGLGDGHLVPPPEAPFRLALERRETTLAATGFVPSQAALAEIVRRAAAVGLTADVSGLRLASGAPPVFDEAAALGIEALGRAREGSFRLDGDGLELTATASDPPAFRALRGLSPPAGLRWVSRSIAPPVVRPYRLTGQLAGSVLTLEGAVPDDAARAALEVPAGFTRRDGTELAQGAPPGFPAAARWALEALLRMREGRFELADRTIALSGLPADPAQFAALEALPPPAGFSLTRELRLPAVSPYRFEVSRAGGTATMTGFVPSGTVRAALVAAAGDAGLAVEDRALLAAGAPPGFPAAAGAAVRLVAGLGEGRAILADRQLSLSGTAASFAAADAAAGTVLPPGYRLAAIEIAPPLISPFLLTLRKSGEAIRAEGVVADDVTRERLRVLIEATGLRADLALRVARGAPSGVDLSAGLAYGLAELNRLDFGTLTLSDGRASLAGEAPDPATAESVRQAVLERPWPGGVTASTAALTSALPYLWRARRLESGLVLDGQVPSEAVRAELLALAARLFPAETVEDRMVVRPSANRTLSGVMSAALRGLSQTAYGEAALGGTRLKLTGEAYFGAAADRLTAALRQAFPPGYELDLLVGVVAPELDVGPEACQPLLDSVLKRGALSFESASAVLDPISLGLLDRLAAAALRCPGVRIEIAGHTDSDGADEANRLLSERRAATVRDHLVGAGVDPARLQALGYGESRPLVPNTSPENKAINRRIELQVR